MATDPLHYYAAEWRRLLAAPGLAAIAATWSRVDPELPAPTDLFGALDAAHEARDFDRIDAVLHALLRCAAGDGVAAYAATVAVSARLVPGLGNVVGTVLAATRRASREVSKDDARATVAGAVWEVVRCYPLTRRRAVAANITLDVTQAALRTLDCHVRCQGRGLATPREELDALASTGPVGDAVNPSEELVELLSWALTERYLTREQTDLVVRRWTAGAKPTPVAVIAEERGWTPRTANRRCAEAVTALTSAALELAA